jgi:hypothetical protein
VSETDPLQLFKSLILNKLLPKLSQKYGIEEEKILKYVEYQGRQDSGQAKLEL